MQVAHTLLFGQVQALQRFHKAREHGQGRADFVRHVGHKVTAHGFGLLHGGDVAREQQTATISIGVHVHRQAHWLGCGAGAPRHEHVALKVSGGEISGKAGVAHQVAKVLEQVTRSLQAEMRLGRLVEPLNAQIVVQQHHAVR